MIAGLHVVTDGTGPVVVLCGGLGGNWFDWDGVAALLDSDHTVVRFDRPGHGLSPPSAAALSVRGEVQRIAAVLDAVAAPGPVVIVGHSLGGMYAEAFTRQYPNRTRGLVLLDATVTTHPRRLIPTTWRVWAARGAARVVSATGTQRLLGPPVRRVLNHAIPPDGITPRTRAWVSRIYRERAFLEAALVENASYPTLATELADMRAHLPLRAAVVVAAAHTGRRTPWGSAWLRRQRAFADVLGARFTVVRPAHHHAMIDQPCQVAALVRILG